uniref:OST-HTH/LOTUS domain-containing protein n=1 Tax=Sphingomonas sp. CFBP 8760 TaxID=2775282 RepID=UPI00314503CB
MTPDFDPRNYGCAKLITLAEKIDAFDVRRDGQDLHPPPQSGMNVGSTSRPGQVSGDPENRHVA